MVSDISIGARVLRRMDRDLRRWRSVGYFRRLKGAYTGRRGFVIGNGPSLTPADLDRIQGEISIASNKIYLIFERTRWRPTFHTMIDPLVIEKIGGEIHQHVESTHLPDIYASMVPKCRQHCYGINDFVRGPASEGPLFSADLTKGVWCGYTVTYDNLQFAAHLGLNPIYILGCDHYYQGEHNVTANVVTRATANNHFDPRYRSPGEVVNPAPVAEMTNAYEHAAEFGRRHGIQIFNATRGGHLEVFPRTELERVVTSV